MVKQVAVLTIGFVLAASWPAGAQYFGRNKVRYEDFDFQVLQTPHFDVYHYSAAEPAVRYAAQLAERWYARLSRVLNHEFRERQPLVLYASHTHFTQTTIVPGAIPEGVGGITEHRRGRVVMPLAAGLAETNHVLGHELVHAFQRDILRTRGRSLAMLPLWFVEGMAEYLTTGGLDPNTAMWLRDAALSNRLPALADLDDPHWFPYRYGQALWAYLAERFGEDVVVRSLVSSAPGGAIGRIKAVTGLDPDTLSRDWHAAIRAAVGADERHERPGTARPSIAPARSGRSDQEVVITRAQGGGRLNVGAALSPDGRELVFLSERDEYSIDVYLADATTGAIKKRLVQTAGNAHFDSLQYIGSAGAWSPDGRRFAMAAIHRGQPVLSILDMPSGNVRQEILLPALDEAFSPSWSPDGRRLVFSALAGGFSDLYVVDLETETVGQLTSDAYADLQPAWSPDGKTIAFVTDRFTAKLSQLEFGDYSLATLDVESHALGQLPSVAGGKNINPQWSPDGRSVYFVADAGRRSNVYRVHLPSGAIYRVTDIDTGVSGITALSPVLSVAQDARRMAFSVYRHGAYDLRVTRLADGERLSDSRFVLAASRTGEDDGAPEPEPPATSVDTPAPPSFTLRPYERRLTLDGIGQPYLSAGGGALGSFFRAGMSFSFGDMLGEQSLRTSLQVGGSAADMGLQVAYLNRQSRWNWALVGEQVGAVIGARRSRVQGSGEVLRQDVRVTQIHRGLNAMAIYPFSRVRRLELGAGVHAVTFDREAVSAVYSTSTGERLEETRDHASAAEPLRLFQGTAAFVHDTAVLGPTSPILGERYRLEIAPAVGDVSFTMVTADYRRYVVPRRPFTFAFRAKHLGRFGRGGRDSRLLPLFYNLRDAVRGYGTREVNAHLCGPGETSCSGLELMRTSHVLMVNSELRFPILGAFTGRASYGPLPMEGFIFTDAALLWSHAGAAGSGDAPEAERWRRLMLRSVGAGVRFNARSFVFEVAGAHALDGGRGWRLAINLGPGF